MSDAETIRANTERFLASLHQELAHLNRPPESVTLVAISKTRPPEAVSAAAAAGLIDFGENRVQEANDKIPAVSSHHPLRWHMVGHLQTNKAKYAAGLFDLIHSVDRIELAQALSRRTEALGKRQDVLIQVNTTAEPQKSGCAPDQLTDLIGEVADCPGLRIMGLMTIGPLTEDADLISRAFASLHKAFEDARSLNLHGGRMSYCSMGMTNDWKIALAEGSNMLRVGRAIFGERT